MSCREDRRLHTAVPHDWPDWRDGPDVPDRTPNAERRTRKVQLLLRLGASTKLRNSFGDSVLHQVWRFWNPKHAVQVGCVLFFQRLSSG